jgi:hypothetical protein
MKLKRIFRKHRTSELVIKRRYPPRVKLFIAGIVVMLLIVASGALYNYGLTTAGVEKFSAFRQQSTLREEIKHLKDENLDLRETLARAQRTLQMDQVAYQELDHSLKDSAKEINRLREEVSFYRNIISPDNKVAGLKIDRLTIDRIGNTTDNQYRYKLVLIQALKHDHTIYGRVRLEVSGAQDGRDAMLVFPSANEKQHNINFKYFQEFEGVMKLPRNFQPSGVKVSITTTSPAAETLEQNHAWPKL